MKHKNILLCVDLQKGFCNSQNKNRINELIKKINKVIKENDFDYYLYSFFRNDTESIFYQNGYTKNTKSIETELIDKLIHKEPYFMYVKRFYTCINDYFIDFIKQQKLDLKHTTFFIVGIDIDACILSTCFDMFNHNIDFKVILDCCISTSNDKHIGYFATEIIKRNFFKKHITYSNQIKKLINLKIKNNQKQKCKTSNKTNSYNKNKKNKQK